jgi:hypothetical protein
VLLEVKSDSFVRYLDSELFLEFAKSKKEGFFKQYYINTPRDRPIEFSPFNVTANIHDQDIINLLRMAEGNQLWDPLQRTKINAREDMYYSYISKDNTPLDGICKPSKALKLVGVLPCSAEEAFHAMWDEKYKQKWEPFMTYQKAVDTQPDGPYDMRIVYGELKLAFFLKTRYAVGVNSAMYDTARRCYISICKTTSAVDITNLKRKRNPIPTTVISITIIYKISETQCRYVIVSRADFQMQDPSDHILKFIMKKRGKTMFNNWIEIVKERNTKERPEFSIYADSLEAFMQKYLPEPTSVKTWDCK